MTSLRRLSYATLFLAFAQIVFGAIVRITGSGLGCGDHWPKCYGRWFPPLDRADLIIEVMHRYIAAALMLCIFSLVVVAWKHRNEVIQRSGRSISAPLFLAVGLVISAALLGAVTVKLDLHHNVVVIHKMIAIFVLGALAVATVRAGGFGSYSLMEFQPAENFIGLNKTYKSAIVAIVLILLTILLGAFTANVAGANGSCQGFPLCRAVLTPGGPLHIHLTHRILAYLLFFHVIGMALLGLKRPQPKLIRNATFAVLGAVFLQILVAAMLVELHLPPFWRSLHQAVGTLIWLTAVVLITLSAMARRKAMESRQIP